MKVLLINGSPHAEGNTFMALNEVSNALHNESIETEIFHIGTQPVQGCIGCMKCKTLGRCVFHDSLYETLLEKVSEADGIIIGSPTYYAGPSGSLCAVLDRLFYSSGKLMAFKPAASVAVARRGGASTCFDRLNKYFSINNMPVVSSVYWNIIYGCVGGEVLEDKEGLQTMRQLGRNMAWLLKSINKENNLPQTEQKTPTNFIR